MSDGRDGENFFIDDKGDKHKDRRARTDRRRRQVAIDFPDRRKGSRRVIDQHEIDRDHKRMIDEALEEFAVEHQRPHGGQ